MIFNLIVLVLFLLIAAYLANQGFLSALLIFISATFAAILAGGLFESLQGIVAGWRPDYARGVTFLVLFLLGLSICRLSSDYVVPKNIKLPRALDTTLGGVMAIFASLVIMGSILIGAQMMPLPTQLLGYERFGGDLRMQAYQDQDGQRAEVPGALASSNSVWLSPDGFTLGIMNLALGRSMGGDEPFSATHPDLLTEAYGYRNVVQYGASETLWPDLLEVPVATTTDDPAALHRFGIDQAGVGKIAALVRTVVTEGADPKISANNGSKGDVSGDFFYVTPSEVRLVTDKGHQYYPLGYLDTGKKFVPLSLDSGQLAEDYSKEKAIDDWVFAINSDEKPSFIEVKELARKDLGDVLKKGELPVLASGDYPPHKIAHDVATVKLAFKGPENAPLEGVSVYLLRSNIHKKDADGPLNDGYNSIPSGDDMNDASKPWGANIGKPGVPDMGMFHTAVRLGQDMKNKAPTDDIWWRDLIPMYLIGKSGPNGAQNLVTVPKDYEQNIVPIFANNELGTAVIKHDTTDAKGTVTMPDVPKGSFTVAATYYKEGSAFYVWVQDVHIDQKDFSPPDFTASTAAFSIVMPK